jgi:hypothetical protein
MSIPYPSDFQSNYHQDQHVRRVERAFKALTVADVLSVLDDLIAAEPDPSKHPCHNLVAYLLDRAWTPGDGGQFWDQWKALACHAIDQLIEARLQEGD